MTGRPDDRRLRSPGRWVSPPAPLPRPPLGLVLDAVRSLSLGCPCPPAGPPACFPPTPLVPHPLAPRHHPARSQHSTAEQSLPPPTPPPPGSSPTTGASGFLAPHRRPLPTTRRRVLLLPTSRLHPPPPPEPCTPHPPLTLKADSQSPPPTGSSGTLRLCPLPVPSLASHPPAQGHTRAGQGAGQGAPAAPRLLQRPCPSGQPQSPPGPTRPTIPRPAPPPPTHTPLLLPDLPSFRDPFHPVPSPPWEATQGGQHLHPALSPAAADSTPHPHTPAPTPGC